MPDFDTGELWRVIDPRGLESACMAGDTYFTADLEHTDILQIKVVPVDHVTGVANQNVTVWVR